MRNLLIGLVLGLSIAGLGSVWAQQHSLDPYHSPAPGLFSEQMNQMQTLSNSTDIYLNEQRNLYQQGQRPCR